jgi:heme A synthase
MKKLFILLMILAAVCFVGVWIYQTQRLKKNAQAAIGKGQVVMNWGLIILFVIGLVGAFAAPRLKPVSRLNIILPMNMPLRSARPSPAQSQPRPLLQQLAGSQLIISEFFILIGKFFIQQSAAGRFSD